MQRSTPDRKHRTKEVRKRLCKRLDLLIDARGKKNVDIVNHLQIDPGTVTHWRRGNSWPGVDLQEPLAEFLGVTPGWYWTEDPVPSR